MSLTLSPVLLIVTAASMERRHPGPDILGEEHGAASLHFVMEAGYRSHRNPIRMTSSWPFRGVRNLDALAASADSHGISYESAEEGDLYLVRDPKSGRFVRIGIVVHVMRRGMPADRYVETTILALDGVQYEHTDGQPGPFIEQLSSQRGDCFIRWVELDRRGDVGIIEHTPEPRHRTGDLISTAAASSSR